MGWSSGGDIADSVWDIVNKYIPDSEKARVALKLIKVFEGYDCDVMQETALWDLAMVRCPWWLEGQDDCKRNCEFCQGTNYIERDEI